MKFAEVRGSRAGTCGETDGHGESNRGCGGYANVSKNQPQNEWKIIASQNLFCRLWSPGENKVSRA